MPDPVNHIGGEGKVTIAGTDPNIDTWDFTETTDENDVTTTQDYDPVTGRVYGRVMGGKTNGEGSFSFLYDTVNLIWPSILKAGYIGTNLVLTESTGHVITFPKWFCKSVAFAQGGIGGVMKITVNFRNQGIYSTT